MGPCLVGDRERVSMFYIFQERLEWSRGISDYLTLPRSTVVVDHNNWLLSAFHDCAMSLNNVCKMPHRIRAHMIYGRESLARLTWIHDWTRSYSMAVRNHLQNMPTA